MYSKSQLLPSLTEHSNDKKPGKYKLSTVGFLLCSNEKQNRYLNNTSVIITHDMKIRKIPAKAELVKLTVGLNKNDLLHTEHIFRVL